MESRSTIKNQDDSRKEYEVLKDWEVSDTTLPYYGSHAPGSIVLVHEDVAAPLVEEGILAAAPTTEPQGKKGTTPEPEEKSEEEETEA